MKISKLKFTMIILNCLIATFVASCFIYFVSQKYLRNGKIISSEKNYQGPLEKSLDIESLSIESLIPEYLSTSRTSTTKTSIMKLGKIRYQKEIEEYNPHDAGKAIKKKNVFGEVRFDGLFIKYTHTVIDEHKKVELNTNLNNSFSIYSFSITSEKWEMPYGLNVGESLKKFLERYKFDYQEKRSEENGDVTIISDNDINIDELACRMKIHHQEDDLQTIFQIDFECPLD